MSTAYSIMEELDSMGTFSDELPLPSATPNGSGRMSLPATPEPALSERTDKVVGLLDSLVERIDDFARRIQELKEEVLDARKMCESSEEEVTPDEVLAGPGDDEYDSYEEEVDDAV
jgi:hypothetical protein